MPASGRMPAPLMPPRRYPGINPAQQPRHTLEPGKIKTGADQ